MKRCSKCGETKPLEAFAKSKANRDGLQYRCRICQASLAREWNHSNKERRREMDKKRYAVHRQKRLSLSKKWRSENLDHCKSRDREYGKERYIKNKSKCLAATKSWAMRNPKKAKQIRDHSNLMRRARLNGAQGTHTREERQYLYESYLGRCAYCFDKSATDFDHVVPLARGGTNDIENLVPSCEFCNASKGAKSLLEFMIYRKAA